MERGSDVLNKNRKMKNPERKLVKKYIIIIVLISTGLLSGYAQEANQGGELKREVTLYNPYKPSLPDVKKKSFLPEINNETTVNQTFTYNVTSNPFTPEYTISQIKPASLLPDPLPKLYKSYVMAGLGSNTTPYAELSISNNRSKKGALGLYARHYSSSGSVPLATKQRVFAGFMDNDASLYGKKFFRKNVFNLSADFMQKVRYAYGYNTERIIYEPVKQDVRLNYLDAGASASFSSLNLDSTDFYYDFGLSYDFFKNTSFYKVNHTQFKGEMAKSFKGFYVGSDVNVDYYTLSDSIGLDPKSIVSVNPFLRKTTSLWNFNLGLMVTFEKNLSSATKIYFYPDVRFGFSVVPQYVRFFSSLTGKLENNDPLKVITENPYMVPDGSLFRVPNTDYSLIFSAGLKGNNGIEGNYLASVSYSVIKNVLFFANIFYPDTVSKIERGNHFIAIPDDAELLNFHGEFSGQITDRLSFDMSGNYYRYTLSVNRFPWNRPDWDGKFGLNYNLRNKIIAGAELTAIGKRKLMSSESGTGWTTLSPVIIEMPVHFNLGLTAEYRYTKILSFWVKVNNISNERYYEWAYYPSQMFNFIFGFSYSL
jgi:hypothetical protein